MTTRQKQIRRGNWIAGAYAIAVLAISIGAIGISLSQAEYLQAVGTGAVDVFLAILGAGFILANS